ncbi:NAD-dependent epimerase/dehydratase family protein [Nocardia sp. NPDC052278]|uniref:NAD-dependent epimerase/dehydratase family protein n=1 Tax=unclassified Nocardia TaxID=2637762 RepID=UPI0036A1CAD6
MENAGRVLVTGGTGAFGAATVKWLRRMGADVVVLARREPARPIPGVSYVQADIQDADSVTRAMQGCSAVAHFAWTVSAIQTPEQAEGIDIGGTRNLLQAMERTDCRRMVFASSITTYGGHADHPQPYTEDEELRPAASFLYERNKVRAERMIAESSVEGVSVRPTVVVGRDAWSAPAQIYRQPLVVTPGREARLQLVHQDDVGRFFALASLGGPTGAVNLVADDPVTWSEIGRLVGRPVLNIGKRAARTLVGPMGWIPQVHQMPDLLELFLHYPLGDTARLKNDFGFTCAYSSAEAAADMADWSKSAIYLGPKAIRKPLRLDTPTVLPPRHASDDGRSEHIIPRELAGEFDTVDSDPDFPEWTAANLSEAFPGPMTPLSLGVAHRVMFSSANMVTRLVPVDERVAELVSTKQVGVIGHRLYNNVSIMHELVTSIPGQTREAFDNQMHGTPLPEGYTPPKLGRRGVARLMKLLAGAGPQAAGLSGEVADIERRADRLAGQRAAYKALTDEALLRYFEQVLDLLVRAWDVNNVNTFLVGAPLTLIEQRYGAAGVDAVRVGTENLRSAALLQGIRVLAAEARRQPAIAAIMRETDRAVVVDKLRSEAPAFAGRLDDLIARCGHRGPGETEFANPVFADAPELLVKAIASALDTSSAPGSRSTAPRGPLARTLIKLATTSIARRERSRDACMRISYELRLILREWGTRLSERGVLTAPGDLPYLSLDEIYQPPVDARERVQRRRAERERLRALPVPVHFTQSWQPESAQQDGDSGIEMVSGLAVSPGVAVGRVRIMSDADDELESGEVLVASVTDTGWTPFFGCAAAVVTDIGGAMSHAAIVAREFGIPAVVNTVNATKVLRTGQLVEVDGVAGTIRTIEAAPVADSDTE